MVISTIVAANATHGQPRTREDKWRAVTTLLLDEEWGKWSDREIGRKTGTGKTLVGHVRASLTGRAASERSYKTKHGTIATMDMAAINADRQELDRLAAEAAAAKAAAGELENLQAETAPHRGARQGVTAPNLKIEAIPAPSARPGTRRQSPPCLRGRERAQFCAE